MREFRRLDLNSEEHGIPVHRLMANAGRAVAEAVRSARTGKRADAMVIVLCGKGNNGGDGFAASGVLTRWSIPHKVVLLDPNGIQGAAARSYLDLIDPAITTAWKGARKTAWKGAIVVDCMLGSGLRDKPRAPYDAAIKWANQNAGHLIACDVPSGLGTSLAIKPHVTVTFHAMKEGMTKRSCGRIIVADIGIPKEATTIGLGDLDAGFVRPQGDSHKGMNGRVLVVGGGPFDGAPWYAAMAAVRSGADLVHVATTDDVARTIKCWSPAPMVKGITADARLGADALPAIASLLHRVDALVIGCGIGTDAGTRRLVADVVRAATKAGKWVVVDADGLDGIDEALLHDCGSRMVLTPHGKEFADLTGSDASDDELAAFAAAHDAVIILKGAVDRVVGANGQRACHRGHVTMTKGGTGDALAGIVGTLLAKGADRFDAACAAAYLAGCAGEIAAELRGHGAIAQDMIEAIPLVLRRLD